MKALIRTLEAVDIKKVADHKQPNVVQMILEVKNHMSHVSLFQEHQIGIINQVIENHFIVNLEHLVSPMMT